MPSKDLIALAERVEAASGPDREIDLAIARHFRVTVWKRNDDDTANYETTYWRYTESIDAAMTLVPEDSWLEIKGPRKYLNIPSPVPGRWSAHLSQYNHERAAMGWGETPALALTAAALRCLAQMEEGRGR